MLLLVIRELNVTAWTAECSYVMNLTTNEFVNIFNAIQFSIEIKVVAITFTRINELPFPIPWHFTA